MFDLIKQQRADNVVIDMRLNGGGDYNEGLKYLVHSIRDLSDINRNGHLFVLVGPNTFSAAMSNSWWDSRSERSQTATRKPAR